VLLPIAIELSPEAVVLFPVAIEANPAAVVLLPIAIDLSPDAVVLNPNATEKIPILSLSHCVPVTSPALNAALSGYHIILAPDPLAGGLLGVLLRMPLNNTLLSFTCNMACGLLVLIPTLPWAIISLLQ
jgi:hypothetical protein